MLKFGGYSTLTRGRHWRAIIIGFLQVCLCAPVPIKVCLDGCCS
ncbi:hypothetical protein ECANGB1_815 [Enterospora canceri]|uniref:Uncharacterized protein n=1 Tax=Enterospora canceri TaxID=1081671 RepID=A0A1Y1S3Q6_9MICR|nr:hypothetical protein ECANGB1_2308 [Enterospora canceri]ORD93173.1 hypothetical protein ECANGB1_815 [Enterospora canceri]